jgi:alkylation response protein AidB-like acyl-CoA dehydrogenase
MCIYICIHIYIGMATKAELNDVSNYTMNGSKMWITNGTLDGTVGITIYIS